MFVTVLHYGLFLPKSEEQPLRQGVGRPHRSFIVISRIARIWNEGAAGMLLAGGSPLLSELAKRFIRRVCLKPTR
jgi:hypothetical protein